VYLPIKEEHLISDVIASAEATEQGRPDELAAALLDEQLIGQLVDRARASGLQLTGEGGLPQQPDQARA
jgi:putative transposase